MPVQQYDSERLTQEEVREVLEMFQEEEHLRGQTDQRAGRDANR